MASCCDIPLYHSFLFKNCVISPFPTSVFYLQKLIRVNLNTRFMIHFSLFLQLLEMLALLTFLFFPGYLCLSCDDFTVSFCSPDPSQTILSLDLPNMGYQWRLCERLCNVQEDCEYWSVSCPEASEPCDCSLLKYSYLHSCEVIGGTVDSDIEVIRASSLKKRLHI